MLTKNKTLRNYIAAPISILALFIGMAVLVFILSGDIILPIAFVYIGVFTAIGMILFMVLPKKRKTLGRLFAYLSVGGALFLGMGVMGRMNIQIEGFFFQVLAGIFAAAVNHFLMAKILGTLLIHRIWCSWACWTMAVLDLLPYKKSPGRLPGKWGWLRYAHFGASLGLVIVLFVGFGYGLREPEWQLRGLYWFLIGNAFYYLVGVILVFALKDNRAFCKYLCPVSVFLRPSSALSLLKIKGDNGLCTDCKACVKKCPMDIRVPEYHQAGKRVLTSECIICLNCVDTCPEGALSASFGVDVGFKGLLRKRGE